MAEPMEVEAFMVPTGIPGQPRYAKVRIGGAEVIVYQALDGDGGPLNYFVVEVDADEGQRFKFYGDPMNAEGEG